MNNKNPGTRARFAQRLRAIRIPRGYKTARSFAQALQIDENRYTRYERAEVEPDLDLLMRICDLLGATPNDLLCDTIGLRQTAIEPSPGFGERHVEPFEPARRTPAPASSGLDDARKAVVWELAELIAEIRSGAGSGGQLEALEKLRLAGPIFARIESDPFRYLRDLPAQLGDIAIGTEQQVMLGNLTKELIATLKLPGNDNA